MIQLYHFPVLTQAPPRQHAAETLARQAFGAALLTLSYGPSFCPTAEGWISRKCCIGTIDFCRKMDMTGDNRTELSWPQKDTHRILLSSVGPKCQDP